MRDCYISCLSYLSSDLKMYWKFGQYCDGSVSGFSGYSICLSKHAFSSYLIDTKPYYSSLIKTLWLCVLCMLAEFTHPSATCIYIPHVGIAMLICDKTTRFLIRLAQQPACNDFGHMHCLIFRGQTHTSHLAPNGTASST